MDKKTEALKLAQEALDVLLTEPIAHKAADRAEYLLLQAAPAIREALAEQPACEHEWLRGACLKCGHSIEQPAQQQEPVAWMRHDGARVTTAADRKNYPDYETRYPIPLYTSPPASKPLTDEELEEMWRAGPYDHGTLYDFKLAARDTEAAHGIKENT